MVAALAGVMAALFGVGVIGLTFHHDVMRVFEARERLRRGGVLLDIEQPGEFAQRHPRLAINIPLAELRRRAHELGPKTTPIVVYAHRWRDGRKAMHLLRTLGYEDVFDAAGVRVKERLGHEALSADASRVQQRIARGIPEEIDLVPRER